MPQDTTNPTRQEREWQQRRQEILDAATHLFGEHGWAGTTMQMIADEAEFSVGYLYRQFPGKHELLDAIISTELERYDTIRRRIRAEHADRPLAALRLQLRTSVEFLHHRASLVPLFLTFESENESDLGPLFHRFQQEDIQLVVDAISKGELKPCDAAFVAAVCNGMAWGVVRHLSETDGLERLAEIPDFIDHHLLDPLTPGSGDTPGKDGQS